MVQADDERGLASLGLPQLCYPLLVDTDLVVAAADLAVRFVKSLGPTDRHEFRPRLRV